LPNQSAGLSAVMQEHRLFRSRRITQFYNAVWVGRRAITKVVDNGTTAQDPLDQIGSTSPLGPWNENQFCEDFVSHPFTLYDLYHGQVTVW
jgi:hypothetical protein